MDASPRRIVDLMTGAGTRFVIPVFQRPYSWEQENCAQLWDDILAVGRGTGAPHFTGSVVWVQQGTMSAGGITPLMLIDGQQRITTITLLVIALARYAKAHPERQLAFSYHEIMGRGYLVDEYKSGDDHYKLLLSQGDRETLKSIEDNLENEDHAIVRESGRLVDNLAFFEGLIDGIDDPNVVWRGIQRLEVVSISLTQGQDNPQLIFESMNSTGKDLSSADLIRNYVLMGHPRQDVLYSTYWRPIEVTLGSTTYDTVFDDFIRDWLTVLYAPEQLVRRDVYQAFKRHFETRGYGSAIPVESLLKELRRFAGYYADIRGGKSKDSEVGLWLARIRRLDISVVDPLLMSFLDDYSQGALDRAGLLSMLSMMESYLFRRTVCDCPTNSLRKFFSTLIGRLGPVKDEGGDYVHALEAFLLNEAGTARRFPTNAEFADCLRTRDAYHFRRSFYLLLRLENSYHPKDGHDFANGTYTIEHIMPQNARAHKDWRSMMGKLSDEEFEHLVHNLGNLTLTAYNSELSDGTFLEKKNRMVGGYKNEYLAISSDLHEATEWTPATIEARAGRLTERALEVWQIPEMDEATRKLFLPQKGSMAQQRSIPFSELFGAGVVKEGDVLTSASPTYPGEAVVTSQGMIRLSNGEEFASPSLSFNRLMQLQGSSRSTSNGWVSWRLGTKEGPLLLELRTSYRESHDSEPSGEPERFRRAFWDGYYEVCAESPAFVDLFGNPSDRAQNSDWWVAFGIGLGNCHLENRVGRREPASTFRKGRATMRSMRVGVKSRPTSASRRRPLCGQTLVTKTRARPFGSERSSTTALRIGLRYRGGCAICC